MKQIILDIAKELDIELIGITTTLDYGYLKDFLYKRSNRGYDNELEEQNIEKRLDVRNVFPNCKSIIAIGIPYAKGYKKGNPIDKGLISVVSFGEDYHIKINRILNDLAQKIKEYIEFNYKICVDTSPLLDREICRNAGIGNYGKNSLLINKELGSFIHLGYLLTDLNLEDDKIINEQDVCENCNLCIKSCPNNAILSTGGINSSKCVSYLTQTKKYIPIEYRKNMKNQIYGCDVCQIVCPKNKKILQLESVNNYDDLTVDLIELMNMSNNEFIKKYGRLSGSWRGKNVWKRNAIISIANLKLHSLFDKVKDELKSPSEMIRIYSAWSLLVLNKQKAKDILNENLKNEKGKVKKEYIKLMEEFHDCRHM
ncbi:tRNA epoxyqueuosine(34) reductase QueG [Sedimentibacter sp. MB31-C6]|uniref:tRNA epoxyqueuosine(34) reductase QueG n=1 Tax=Sedimentibacter sp. MB31-C6 TaxID=3109366 RepID=UPI002DDD9BB6|nr:tRNA epoxyqueuosine(34) reductase QueG [Sedimentibacter sp. MB36-C1]WSI04066.1 tRNA epoxyqueuosine(34) reductase QueG [Sedimentibacter sp. MB36-C1]